MTTILPVPSAESSKRGEYAHVRELRAELAALVEDIPHIWDPLDKDDHRGRGARRHLRVAVYVPGGYRAAIFMGAYPMPGWGEAIDRMVAHLPGARAVYDGHYQVQWGSRDPDWTPTAVPVHGRLSGPLWREPDTIWTVEQVAEHIGVAPSTWRSYVARRDAGAPSSLGTIHVQRGPREYPVEVWDAETVREWHATRPGKGGRPRSSADA